MKTILLFLHLTICTIILNAQSVTWTGATSSDWGTKTNWNSNTVPTAKDSVIIPITANSPILDIDRAVGNILIQFDAVLDFGSNKLIVNEDFTNDGAIKTSGSTIVFSGEVAQNIDGNHTFNNVDINNANGVTNNWGETTITGDVNLIAGTFVTNNSVVLVYDGSEKKYREALSGTNITRCIAVRK